MHGLGNSDDSGYLGSKVFMIGSHSTRVQSVYEIFSSFFAETSTFVTKLRRLHEQGSSCLSLIAVSHYIVDNLDLMFHFAARSHAIFDYIKGTTK